MVEGKRRGTHDLARLFWLVKFGQHEEEFGQPDDLAIWLTSLLEYDFAPKLPKFNLESGIRRLLEMLSDGERGHMSPLCIYQQG
jgi:hypothetical protein